MEIQITGIRKHVAVCVTESGGMECGVRSSVWDTPTPLHTWIRAHADETGHTEYKKHTEEPVNAFSVPVGKAGQ
ncbi:hypothetical protein [Streptomyces sp. NPDC052496]|uniref:DUF7848 domain-containing protein n=1 Tax=Streptomyces sp. NPDC052496 TaxID=3154951 RepID=UPI00341A13FC